MGCGAVSDKNSHIKWKQKNQEQLKITQRKASKKYFTKNKDKIYEKQRERRQHMKEGAACEVIKQHHEDMKDDPESLTTEFMKSIVNGSVMITIHRCYGVKRHPYRMGEHD